MCAFWPAAGVNLVKVLIGRYRPIDYLSNREERTFPSDIAETWLGFLPNEQWNTLYATQAFPSAHTATSWGLAIGMAWAFPKGRWLFFGIALLTSIQRVTSAAHWPSDVFFGAAIAFVMAGAITQNWGFGYWFGRFENRNALRLLTAEDECLEREVA
jgi:membrane-associated phospholipid phosphatase